MARNKVKTETQLTYTNKFSKKTIAFVPKGDEVLATFHDTPTAESALNVVRSLSLPLSQSVHAARAFAVFQVKDAADLDSAATSLEARPEIANAIPVLVDDEGLTRYFLPDELTVQFKDGVTKKQMEDIVKRLKSSVIVEQRTPGYYTLAVPEDKG